MKPRNGEMYLFGQLAVVVDRHGRMLATAVLTERRWDREGRAAAVTVHAQIARSPRQRYPFITAGALTNPPRRVFHEPRPHAGRPSHDRWRAPGLCRVCGDPARPGWRLCDLHADITTAAMKARHARLVAEGTCTTCGTAPARADRQTCAACADRHRIDVLNQWAVRVSNGLCTACGKRPPEGERHGRPLRTCAPCRVIDPDRHET